MASTSATVYVQSSNPKVKLFTKTWSPAAGTATIATVIFCHGYGEHIQRYEELFSFFASQGIKVGSFDQRGFGVTGEKDQGGTGGIPGVLEDIKLVSDKTRIDGIPHFIMGQSMGGFLSLYYSSLHPSEFTGAIACSPLITAKITPTFVEKFALGNLVGILPGLRLPVALDVAFLTHEKEEVIKYQNDKLVHALGDLRLLSFLALQCQPVMMEAAPKYKLPFLLVHGSDDQITDPATSKAFFKATASTDKTYELVEGGYHEIHNEVEELKRPIFTVYAEWIKGHAKAKL